MKKIVLLLSFLIATASVVAQDCHTLYIYETPGLSGPNGTSGGLSVYISENGGGTTFAPSSDPDYSVLWSTGSTADFISGLSKGVYTVTITNSVTGCEVVESHYLGYEASPESNPGEITDFTIGSSPETCAENNDGQLTITVTAGTGPYTVRLLDRNSSFNTSQTITNNTGSTVFSGLNGGAYDIYVVNGNGYSTTDIGLVALDQVTVIGVVVEPVSCNGDTDGVLKAVIDNNGVEITDTTNYRFAWSTGETTQVVYNKSPGVYNVTITSVNNGCVDSADVVLPETPVLSISVVSTVNATGANIADGSISVTANGGTPTVSNYTYTWDDEYTSVGTVSKNEGLYPGTYFVTVTDKNGCTDQTSATIGPISLPSLIGAAGNLHVTGDPDDIEFISVQEDLRLESMLSIDTMTGSLYIYKPRDPVGSRWDMVFGPNSGSDPDDEIQSVMLDTDSYPDSIGVALTLDSTYAYFSVTDKINTSIIATRSYVDSQIAQATTTGRQKFNLTFDRKLQLVDGDQFGYPEIEFVTNTPDKIDLKSQFLFGDPGGVQLAIDFKGTTDDADANSLNEIQVFGGEGTVDPKLTLSRDGGNFQFRGSKYIDVTRPSGLGIVDFNLDTTELDLRYVREIPDYERVITVDSTGNGDFTTIAEALAHANTFPGGVGIVVYPGTYYPSGTITLNRDKTSLYSVIPGKAVIDHLNSGGVQTMAITGDDIYVGDFTILTGGTNSKIPIALSGAGNITFSGNYVTVGTSGRINKFLQSDAPRAMIVQNRFVHGNSVPGTEGGIGGSAGTFIGNYSEGEGGAGNGYAGVSGGLYVSNTIKGSASVSGGTFENESYSGLTVLTGAGAPPLFKNVVVRNGTNNSSAVTLHDNAIFSNSTVINHYDGPSSGGSAVRFTTAGIRLTTEGGAIIASDSELHALDNTSGGVVTWVNEGTNIEGRVDTSITIQAGSGYMFTNNDNQDIAVSDVFTTNPANKDFALDLRDKTSGIVIPSGSTTPGVEGAIRRNPTTLKFQGVEFGTQWENLATERWVLEQPFASGSSGVFIDPADQGKLLYSNATGDTLVGAPMGIVDNGTGGTRMDIPEDGGYLSFRGMGTKSGARFTLTPKTGNNIEIGGEKLTFVTEHFNVKADKELILETTVGHVGMSLRTGGTPGLVIGNANAGRLIGFNTVDPRADFDINHRGSMIVPSGLTNERQDTIVGMLRHSLEKGKFEVVEFGTQWVNLATEEWVTSQTSNWQVSSFDPNDVFRPSGDVGIGVENIKARLDVNGRILGRSSLTLGQPTVNTSGILYASSDSPGISAGVFTSSREDQQGDVPLLSVKGGANWGETNNANLIEVSKTGPGVLFAVKADGNTELAQDLTFTNPHIAHRMGGEDAYWQGVVDDSYRIPAPYLHFAAADTANNIAGGISFIAPGNQSNTQISTGNIEFETGPVRNGEGISGSIEMRTGESTSTGVTGSITLETGGRKSATSPGGGITLHTRNGGAGTQDVQGASGDITLTTREKDHGTGARIGGGNIYLQGGHRINNTTSQLKDRNGSVFIEMGKDSFQTSFEGVFEVAGWNDLNERKRLLFVAPTTHVGSNSSSSWKRGATFENTPLGVLVDRNSIAYDLHIGGTGAVKVSTGTTLQRPVANDLGAMRANSDSLSLEFNDGLGWLTLATRDWVEDRPRWYLDEANYNAEFGNNTLSPGNQYASLFMGDGNDVTPFVQASSVIGVGNLNYNRNVNGFVYAVDVVGEFNLDSGTADAIENASVVGYGNFSFLNTGRGLLGVGTYNYRNVTEGQNLIGVGDNNFISAKTAYQTVAVGSSIGWQATEASNSLIVGSKALGVSTATGAPAVDTTAHNILAVGDHALHAAPIRSGIIAVGEHAMEGNAYRNAIGLGRYTNATQDGEVVLLNDTVGTRLTSGKVSFATDIQPTDGQGWVYSAAQGEFVPGAIGSGGGGGNSTDELQSFLITDALNPNIALSLTNSDFELRGGENVTVSALGDTITITADTTFKSSDPSSAVTNRSITFNQEVTNNEAVTNNNDVYNFGTALMFGEAVFYQYTRFMDNVGTYIGDNNFYINHVNPTISNAYSSNSFGQGFFIASSLDTIRNTFMQGQYIMDHYGTGRAAENTFMQGDGIGRRLTQIRHSFIQGTGNLKNSSDPLVGDSITHHAFVGGYYAARNAKYTDDIIYIGREAGNANQFKNNILLGPKTKATQDGEVQIGGYDGVGNPLATRLTVGNFKVATDIIPTDGQGLVYSAADGEYVPGNSSGGGIVSTFSTLSSGTLFTGIPNGEYTMNLSGQGNANIFLDAAGMVAGTSFKLYVYGLDAASQFTIFSQETVGVNIVYQGGTPTDQKGFDATNQVHHIRFDGTNFRIDSELKN